MPSMAVDEKTGGPPIDPSEIVDPDELPSGPLEVETYERLVALVEPDESRENVEVEGVMTFRWEIDDHQIEWLFRPGRGDWKTRVWAE